MSKANKDFMDKKPWYKHYKNAYHRCHADKYYEGRIKLLMTPEDFETLWNRDVAYLLARPTVHRIDSEGDYTIANCKYIEQDAHRKLHSEQRKTDAEFSKTMGKATTLAYKTGTRVGNGLENIEKTAEHKRKIGDSNHRTHEAKLAGKGTDSDEIIRRLTPMEDCLRKTVRADDLRFILALVGRVPKGDK